MALKKEILDKIRFRCEFCDLTYTRKENLNHHISTIHKNEYLPKMFECKTCGICFTKKDF